MPSSPPRFCRHFLPWDRPWLPQAAAWLARDWAGPGPLDLSRVLAVVPTRQAGRRLREALAEVAAVRGAAALPPRIETPETMLAAGAAAPGVATRLEALLAWTRVLRAGEIARWPDVFPVAPPRRDLAWAWRLAESLWRLQTQLAEGGLGLADVAADAGPAGGEAERWRQLAELERGQCAALAAVGRTEPHAARRAWAREPARPAGSERIVVLAVPDPIPLAVDVLARWSEHLPVDLAIFAPETEGAAFDAAGRPHSEIWRRRPILLPDFTGRVHLCADPAAAAEQMAAVAGRVEQPDGLIALGVADAELLPPVERELARAGVTSFNPDGRARRDEGLHVLLTALAALGRAATAETVAALVRCPDFLAALRGAQGEGFATVRALAAFDAGRARHLPVDLAGLQRFAPPNEPELRRMLEFVQTVRAALGRGFPAGAVAALTELYRGVRYDRASAGGARALAALTAWRETLRECAAAAALFPELDAAEWWEVSLRLFGESRYPEPKPAGALELQGWLELLWEDAPHLVVAGLNEGVVPEAVVGDAFLPEGLRERLGLKTNAARFARDAYLLQAIAAARAASGRIELLYLKQSAAGDPLQPSRLLLQCAEEELPARIAFLFRPAEAARPSPAWTRAWRLTPRRVAPPARVPVTGLRAWLACPFRFYLKHLLRLEPVDVAKSELDARDFGTLCHAALEAMARAPALRGCSDERVLRDFLLEALEQEAQARFGALRTVPLVVQLESARQRLARAAAVQAREHAAGWTIERTEWPFVLDCGGLEVRGRIDRIDRHEATGAWRVLDYKTSDTGVAPAQAHLRARRAGEAGHPPWRGVTIRGREHVWIDLQLPVYLRALGREAAGATSLTCGYFNLPRATGETALALWPELTGDVLAAAAACTDGAAAAIRAGEFWPPAELAAERDEFAALFQEGAAESVAWEEAAR